MTHPFLKIADYVAAHPPTRGEWAERGAHVLYMHPHVRVRVAIDQSTDIGYGLHRDDVLAEELGISTAESDSAAFAEDLHEAIGGHLSIRNLRDLVAVFTRELQEAEARRQAHIDRLGLQTSATPPKA